MNNDINQKMDFLLKNITFSNQKNQKIILTLEGFFSDQKHKNNFVKNEFCHFSLITEEKKYYVSLGKKKEFNFQKLDQILKTIPCLLKNYSLNINLESLITKELQEEIIFDRFLHHYFFNCYQPISYNLKKQNQKIHPFHIITKIDINQAKQKLEKKFIILKAINFCRDLQDSPPNILNAESYAEFIKKNYHGYKSLKCKILDRKQIEKENMNLLLSVNAGSAHEPRVVVLEYFNNQKSNELTTLLGKGITFDSGGYSLKPSRYQIGMKFDMSGSAIVLSVMQAISDLQLKVNVVAIACITDNKIGSKATLVESVIKSKSGLMVEITNTDAEGRLVLADGITYAQEKYLEKYSKQQIIEFSTLTGAISVALGNSFTGAFSNNDSLYNDFYKSSQKQHELIWRLPVIEDNHKLMESKIADFVNSSKGYIFGSSNAAAFLFKFAKKTPFLHLDIAGTATDEVNNRGLGIMIPTIIQFLQFKQQKNKLK